MKHRLGLLGASSILALTIGCSASVNGRAELEQSPPKSIHGTLHAYHFQDALSSSDLVVKVEIEKKTRELSDPSPKTLFQAKILDELKADPSLDSNEIHILQQGNREWLFNDNDLFSEKDRYVLFLKRAIDIAEPNTYWILGEETGMYKDSGNGKLLKLSYYDKQLEDIEDKKLTTIYMKDNEQKRLQKDVQVIHEQQLKDKVKKTLGK